MDTVPQSTWIGSNQEVPTIDDHAFFHFSLEFCSRLNFIAINLPLLKMILDVDCTLEYKNVVGIMFRDILVT